MALDSDLLLTTLLQRYKLDSWFKFGDFASSTQPADTDVQQVCTEYIVLQVCTEYIELQVCTEYIVQVCTENIVLPICCTCWFYVGTWDIYIHDQAKYLLNF